MNRRFRLLAAVGMTMVLATAMIYTALASGDVQEPVLQAAELGARESTARAEVVQLDGVAAGPVDGTAGEEMSFHVTDAEGDHRLRVEYSGSVPDAFRVGRHVLVKGKLHGDGEDRVFRAEPNSLVTKCPSKFESDESV